MNSLPGPLVRFLSLMALLTVSAHGQANQSTTPVDPRALMRAANAALAKTKALRCEFVQEYYGAARPKQSTKRIACLVARGEASPRIALSGEHVARDGSVTSKFQVIHAGSTTQRILHHERKVIQALGADTGLSLLLSPSSEAQGVLPVGLYLTEQVCDPQESYTVLDHEGQVMVDGRLCDVIYCEDGHEDPYKQRLRYYLSVTDRLPRRFESVSMKNGRTSIVVVTLKNLEIDPEVKAQDFVAAVPADYVVEVFAQEQRAPSAPVLPDWTLPNPQGTMHRAAQYRGKILIMDFWGIWCQPCVEALPHIQALHEEFAGQDIIVLGMAYGDEPADVAEFIKRKGYTFPQLMVSQAMKESLAISTFPTMLVVDADGKLDLIVEGGGEAKRKRIADRARELLAQRK